MGGSRVVHEALADLKKSKIFLAGLFILYVKMSSWESIFVDEMISFKFDHFSLLPLISWKDVTQPANQLCLQRGRSDSIFSFHCTLTAPQSVSPFIFLPEMQSRISVSLQVPCFNLGFLHVKQCLNCLAAKWKSLYTSSFSHFWEG